MWNFAFYSKLVGQFKQFIPLFYDFLQQTIAAIIKLVDVIERALASQHIAYFELQFACLVLAEGVDILAMDLVLQACEILERRICYLFPNLLKFLLFCCKTNEFFFNLEDFFLLTASFESYLGLVVRTVKIVANFLKSAIEFDQRLDC